MTRKGILVSAIAALLLAGSSLSPQVIEAKVLTLNPVKFKSYGSPSDGRKWAGSIRGSAAGSSCSYWHPIKIPVGSEIRKIVFYHRGTVGQPATTHIVFSRSRFGEMPEQIVTGSSSDNSGNVIEKVVTLPTPVVVERGYRYVLSMGVSNWFGTFLGARIYYR